MYNFKVNSSRRRELESKIMGFLNNHEVFNNRQDPDHRTRPNRHSGNNFFYK